MNKRKLLKRLVCFIPSKKLRKHLREKYHLKYLPFSHYGTRYIYNEAESNDLILKTLQTGKPCLIIRFGRTELKAIEDFDAALPILLEKKPDVLVITGDHSTPAPMKGHSWHPQPVMIHSQFSGSDKLERFTDTGANLGSLGVFPAKYLIRYIQANAGMLAKFGA